MPAFGTPAIPRAHRLILWLVVAVVVSFFYVGVTAMAYRISAAGGYGTESFDLRLRPEKPATVLGTYAAPGKLGVPADLAMVTKDLNTLEVEELFRAQTEKNREEAAAFR